jgi:hypothetical protein
MIRGGLGPIVAALGGDLYAGGRRACVPGPGHGPGDRSLSLLLDGDRVVAHSFAGDDWRVALADLRARGLLDRNGRVAGSSAPAGIRAPRPSAAARIRVARALWAEGVALTEASTAARHLRRRGVGEALADLADLRAHPAAPVSAYRPGVARRPALLAAVRGAEGEVTAVEVTYLSPDGRRADRLALPRKALGAIPAGAAVRLKPAGASLLVAEGLFTALSAGARFGLPCWALLSTTNLRRWRAPPGVRRVLIAGDRGRDGERSAVILAAALRGQGVAAAVRFPPPGRGDWNDLQRAGG